jgi:nucleoside phosphorylase
MVASRAFSVALFLTAFFWVERASAPEFARIGIVFAFDPELKAVEEAVIPKNGKSKVEEVNGTRFRQIDLYGKHLYFFLSGVSMVNAALTTQMAIDHFQLDALIFSGIAWKVQLHEMEGTAIAQVGYINRVPVLIIRGISDSAGGQRGPNWEEIHTRLASRNAALVTAATLWKMSSP